MHSNNTSMKITRRSFITQVAATTALSPFILPSRIRAAETAPNGFINMAFIGMGLQNRMLLTNFLSHKVKVVAVCDVDEKHAAEAAAKFTVEGRVPKIYGEGWMIVGDSGGFVNAAHREGSNLAMTSGRLAAETVIAARAAGHVVAVLLPAPVPLGSATDRETIAAGGAAAVIDHGKRSRWQQPAGCRADQDAQRLGGKRLCGCKAADGEQHRGGDGCIRCKKAPHHSGADPPYLNPARSKIFCAAG